MAFDNLVDPELEGARLVFALTNLMNAPEVAEIGMGDLVDQRLTRSVSIVVESYGFERTPEASEIFNPSFLPPVAKRGFEAVINQATKPRAPHAGPPVQEAPMSTRGASRRCGCWPMQG